MMSREFKTELVATRFKNLMARYGVPVSISRQPNGFKWQAQWENGKGNAALLGAFQEVPGDEPHAKPGVFGAFAAPLPASHRR